MKDEKIKHTEKTIIELLDEKYYKISKFKVSNIFLFKEDWESDFIYMRRDNGYCNEIEIKISRSDFFNDFKKVEKHSILTKGKYDFNYKKYNRSLRLYEEFTKLIEWNFRPNKFFYCVPENLIKIDEVPEYAGLIYVTENDVYVVKEAKFLHKEKLKLEDKLCIKFYYYWLNCKEKIKKLIHLNEKLKKENEKLKSKNIK